MTTLTRELLLALEPRTAELQIEPFGLVTLREASEVTRSRRNASYTNGSGNIDASAFALRRVHQIVDQVLTPDGSAMFNDADIPKLSELAGTQLDPLCAAIADFNGPAEKNGAAELSDSANT